MNQNDTLRRGKVYLIGAGPGDPDLLTLKGCDALRRCDVVIYDALINPVLVQHAPAGAEQVFIGPSRDRNRITQTEVFHLMIERARQGKVVARLKGGDPFIFGRGGEEALALNEAGVAWEVVPGVSSGHAVPAYAGIPLTHRAYASSVAFVTGHECYDKDPSVEWKKIATAVDTLVIFMGADNLPFVVAALIEAGRAPSTPMAVVEQGTTPNQRVRVATLETILETVGETSIETPALIVVGDVVSLAHQLSTEPWAFPSAVGECHTAASPVWAQDNRPGHESWVHMIKNEQTLKERHDRRDDLITIKIGRPGRSLNESLESTL